MGYLLLAGLGLTELIIVLFVALIGPALVVLVIIGVVRSSSSRRPQERSVWPPENLSPYQVHQAIGARLQSLGVTPWAIEVQRSTRTVTVELVQPASAHLGNEIRKALAPFNVEVVWYDDPVGEQSSSPDGETLG